MKEDQVRAGRLGEAGRERKVRQREEEGKQECPSENSADLRLGGLAWLYRASVSYPSFRVQGPMGPKAMGRVALHPSNTVG